jgi:hypothetical protein
VGKPGYSAGLITRRSVVRIHPPLLLLFKPLYFHWKNYEDRTNIDT